VRRAEARGIIAAILVSRSVIEAALFAGLLAVAQGLTSGDRALPIVSVMLALTGVGIVLASILRDARAVRQNAAITLGAMAAMAALGVYYASARPDGLQILTRIVLFGILGEAFVWRILTVARALVRWSDARTAGFTAIALLAVVALLPGPTDRTGLVIVGLLAIGATGIALSLARSAEELALAGSEGRGETGRSTASGTAIFLAILTVIGAVVAPYAGELARELGERAAPVVGSLLYGVLLALGYVAEFFVNLVRSFARTGNFIQLPRSPFQMTPEEEAEQLREIEATRPYIFGAVEIVIGAVALLVVVILVDRMLRERREALPAGATLDRESHEGEGLGAFLAGLLPRRAPRRRPPHDDGTPAGALRALYWRYLARADASGVPWRATGETPAEHHRRAVATAPRLSAAGVLVRAFEDFRYGERDPDAATVADARRALAESEVKP